MSALGVTPKLYSTGSGRYLVWLSDEGQVVNVFNTLAKQVSTFPVLPSGSTIVAVDSSRSSVFADAFGETFILDLQLGTVRSVRGSSDESSPLGLSSVLGAHASSIERLFIARARPLGSSDPVSIDVVDVAAGRLERTLALATDFVTGIAVDADGRRLFVAGFQELQVYDAQSGALLMQFPGFRGVLMNNQNALQIDEPRRRLLLTLDGPPGIPQQSFGALVAAFNLDTLALLGIASGGEPYWSTAAQLLTGPRSPIYVFSPFLGSQEMCGVTRLEVLDASSGALRQRVDALRLWGAVPGVSVCRAHLALQSPPPAPMIQSQIVSGHRVTLSWTPAYDALHYDIEAGSEPGLNDLAVLRVGHTSLTIDGVPSERYFVRVRAINAVGRSLPSNEVEVIVP